MTSPQSISVRFEGGPHAGHLAEFHKRPAALVRIESSPEGAYVLDESGRSYGWHLPAPADESEPEADERAPQHRPRTRRR